MIQPRPPWHGLHSSEEPAVRYLTRRELLGDRDGAAAVADAAQLLEGPKARALLAGQQPDGGFGVHAYRKWTGAHWRLMSLVELAAPAGEPRLQAAASTVLDWLASDAHLRTVTVVNGLTRRCASQEGNALAVACRLGMAGDPRVELLARSLVDWQWPDGGWNCDLWASGRRSWFHESLPPVLGLHEYWLATDATWGASRSRRGAPRTRRPELDREQNQPQEQDPTLFPAGQAGGDGGLVGLLNALAVLDRRADPRPRDLIEAILEGKPPFGVASLLNHAVHRAWLRSYSWLEGEAGAGRPPRRWRGSPALQLTGSTR